MAAIASSLQRWGQYRPIVVNAGTVTGRRMEVLAGNHTLLAARSLGWESIECAVVDVDEETAAAIVLADNRLADLGEYSADDLHALLSSLDDLTGTGYTGVDLDELLAATSPPGADDWGDAMPDTPPDGPTVFTRSFTLTADQVTMVDAAIETARHALGGVDGNANGAALTMICAAYE